MCDSNRGLRGRNLVLTILFLVDFVVVAWARSLHMLGRSQNLPVPAQISPAPSRQLMLYVDLLPTRDDLTIFPTLTATVWIMFHNKIRPVSKILSYGTSCPLGNCIIS